MKDFVLHLGVILLMWQAYSYLHIRNKQFPWGMVSRPFSLETDLQGFPPWICGDSSGGRWSVCQMRGDKKDGFGFCHVYLDCLNFWCQHWMPFPLFSEISPHLDMFWNVQPAVQTVRNLILTSKALILNWLWLAGPNGLFEYPDHQHWLLASCNIASLQTKGFWIHPKEWSVDYVFLEKE